MCSIYGSYDRSRYDVYHDATVERGNYAYSHAFIGKKCFIHRQKGQPNMDNIKELKGDYLFLGHNQAPTSSAREYSRDTCHPFIANNWVVAHNGVLTNYKALNKKYCSWNKNVVDSATIPNLIYYFQIKEKKTELEAISAALSLLEGTFAVWIINEETGNVFIAHQGSTLFGNVTRGDFCSIKGTGLKDLKEGVIYKLDKKLVKVGKFVNTTPFLDI